MLSSVWRFQDSDFELLYSNRSRATVPGPMPLQPVKRGNSKATQNRARLRIVSEKGAAHAAGRVLIRRGLRIGHLFFFPIGLCRLRRSRQAIHCAFVTGDFRAAPVMAIG